MRKYVVALSILLGEIFELTIMGYLWKEYKTTLVMVLLILSVILCFFTSILFAYLFRDKKPKVDRTKKCPYFIEKYDDMANPEYIDRSLE